MLQTNASYPTAYNTDSLGDTKSTILIGGKLEKFVPNLNVSFECESGAEKYFINLNRRSLTVSDDSVAAYTPAPKPTLQNPNPSDQISLDAGGETHVWHVDSNGRLKWDMVFDEKPATNVFEWDTLHSPELQFFYQPPLTDEEVKRGCIRPDEVVGSYAVYCDQKHNWQNPDGSVIANYYSGKLCHIYAPLCTDANNNQIYASLNISDGKLTVTIPQAYLDTAAYPVTLDPTFGYSTVGGSADSEDQDQFSAATFGSPSSSGTLTALTVGCYGDASGHNIRLALYPNATGTPPASNANPGGQTPISGSDTGPLAVTQLGECTQVSQCTTGSCSGSVTAGNYYWVCFNCDDLGIHPMYDTGSSPYDMFYVTAHSYASFPDNPAPSFSTNFQAFFTTWATYTAGGTTLSTTHATLSYAPEPLHPNLSMSTTHGALAYTPRTLLPNLRMSTTHATVAYTGQPLHENFIMALTHATLSYVGKTLSPSNLLQLTCAVLSYTGQALHGLGVFIQITCATMAYVGKGLYGFGGNVINKVLYLTNSTRYTHRPKSRGM